MSDVCISKCKHNTTQQKVEMKRKTIIKKSPESLIKDKNICEIYLNQMI